MTILKALESLCQEHDKVCFKRKRSLTTFSILSLLGFHTGRSLRNIVGLESFYENLSVSAAAVSKARKKLGWGIFRRLLINSYELFSIATKEKYRWKGLRVFAIDGTRIHLPRELTQSKYKRPSPASFYPQGLLSVLFDIKAKLPYTASLCRHQSEQRTAIEHLKRLSNTDLVVYDRGYACTRILQAHQNQNIPVLVRLPKSTFRSILEVWESNSDDQIITIDNKNIKIKLRIIKYWIKGHRYVLGTTLLDQKKYSLKDFKKLYFERWNIEEFYKTLKHKLLLENFRSRSIQGVKQEVFTALIKYLLCKLAGTPERKNSWQKRKSSTPFVIQMLDASMSRVINKIDSVRANVLDLILKNSKRYRLKYKLNRSFKRISRKPMNKWKLSASSKKRYLKMLAATEIPP